MSGCAKLIGYVVIAVVALIVVAAVVNSGNSNRQQVVPANASISPASASGTGEKAEPTIAPTATPEWMAPGYTEMCDNNSTMTDVQQERYAATMAGKKIVEWTGAVFDVENRGGSYQLQIDVDGGIFSTRDVVIHDIDEDLAIELSPEQIVQFSGTIRSVDMAFETICNPINIISATVTVMQ